MENNTLQKLSRGELLKLLLEEKKENERLQSLCAEQAKQLEVRQLRLRQAGSIAEAALSLNGVFEAAQQAAADYLSGVEELSARQPEASLSQVLVITFTRDAARNMKDKLRELLEQTAQEGSAAAEKALQKHESDQYYADMMARLEKYMQEHRELSSLLSKLPEHEKG